ncbi:GMC oxidoreductase [Fodinicola acaciae]|uniref:GMC oxidoreductase n=1 Tax=Fodinicola acaciae TaxID=2681555 RepID=UPI0013D2ED38|nr:GMC family oxidoreductase [Fodinicola acaciae]
MARVSGHGQDGAVRWVDAVVVGSGFGGAVAACRLAEAGRSVCVLERGKTYPPGSFPRRPDEMARNFWDPSEGMQGLFDIWSFRRLESIVASGVGGGSLIYANVMLRKDERWFVRDTGPAGGFESWPVTREDLEPWYDRAEKMLGATGNPYPHTDRTPKTQAMRKAAGQLGMDWFRPPLAVTFHAEGGRPGDAVPDSSDNLHGAQRQSCRLCGECDFGCNFGAKNSLDFTYLSAAVRAGAEIHDRSEVKEFFPVDGGYEVRYVRHHAENEGIRRGSGRQPRHVLRCRSLILGAGTFGSTYLLLRNRDSLPNLSSALGTRFCGNGDLLGLVLESPDTLNASTGPVITSTIRVPDTLDGGNGRGYYIQDGGFPGFVDWIAETGGVIGPSKRIAKFAMERLMHKLAGGPRQSQIGTQIAGLVGDGRFSSGALPLLGMGRDVPDGRLRLEQGLLELDWCDDTSRDYFARVEASMAAIAEQLGGRFVINPTRHMHRIISPHPLGGVPMATDPEHGVVDAYGEVFGHPGLYVVDGSVMPGPVGANPSLTIAALSERFTDHLLEPAA